MNERRPRRMNRPVRAGSSDAGGVQIGRIDAQKRVRMPIVPTIWLAVVDAPPDVLMNAW